MATIRKLFLVKSDPKVAGAFQTDDFAPLSGIYRVIHSQHRLPHLVTVFQDQAFPRCCKCNNSVRFELVQGISEIYHWDRITLHELPIVEDGSRNSTQVAS